MTNIRSPIIKAIGENAHLTHLYIDEVVRFAEKLRRAVPSLQQELTHQFRPSENDIAAAKGEYERATAEAETAIHDCVERIFLPLLAKSGEQTRNIFVTKSTCPFAGLDIAKRYVIGQDIPEEEFRQTVTSFDTKLSAAYPPPCYFCKAKDGTAEAHKTNISLSMHLPASLIPFFDMVDEKERKYAVCKDSENKGRSGKYHSGIWKKFRFVNDTIGEERKQAQGSLESAIANYGKSHDIIFTSARIKGGHRLADKVARVACGFVEGDISDLYGVKVIVADWEAARETEEHAVYAFRRLFGNDVRVRTEHVRKPTFEARKLWADYHWNGRAIPIGFHFQTYPAFLHDQRTHARYENDHRANAKLEDQIALFFIIEQLSRVFD